MKPRNNQNHPKKGTHFPSTSPSEDSQLESLKGFCRCTLPKTNSQSPWKTNWHSDWTYREISSKILIFHPSDDWKMNFPYGIQPIFRGNLAVRFEGFQPQAFLSNSSPKAADKMSTFFFTISCNLNEFSWSCAHNQRPNVAANNGPPFRQPIWSI